MVNIFLYEDYRLFLSDEFQRRKFRNRKYSLRAFARDLDMSFSRISEILSRNTPITITTSQKIADKLGMNDLEKDYFTHLVISLYGRNADLRKKSISIVKKYKAKKIFVRMQEGYDTLLARWYYTPLIEFITLKEDPPLSQIAQYLEISLDELTAAILHLESLGYLVRDDFGQWAKPQAFLKIESPNPSALIRKSHRKALENAHHAIEKQPLEKRKYLSGYFGIRKENIPEARRELEKIHADFLQRFACTSNANSVYCFSLQLFSMESS